MKRKTKTKKANEKDEVEELLQAAQDDMLLKLSLDSHISRGVSLGDADVDRRFHALKLKTTIGAGAGGVGGAASKSKSNSNFNSNFNSNSNAIQVDEELKAVLGDDLSARFAALKASGPKPSSSSAIQVDAAAATLYDDSDDEEDEVEKLIRWAKDAARLDPSPPSESDDDDEIQNKKGNGPDCK